MRKRIGFLVVVWGLSLCTLLPALYAAEGAPGVIQACIEHGNQRIYVVGPNETCKIQDTPIVLSTSASGSGGGSLVFQKRWNDQSVHPYGTWHPVPASEVTATIGGGPLLVQMNLSLEGGSHSTCRPIIDGQWAGDFSGQIKSYGDPYWTEGVIATGCCGGGLRAWTTSKVYTDVPPGSHTFAVQCATDGGILVVNDGGSRFSSWSVTELK